MSNPDNEKYKINRSADSSFDFLGLKGSYFYVFLGVIGGVFAYIFIIGSTKLAGLLSLLFIPVAILVGAYFGLKKFSNQYGNTGIDGYIHSKTSVPPKIRNSRESFSHLK